MKNLKIIKKNLRRIVNKILSFLNSFGNQKQCYICKKRFHSFTKFNGGYKKLPLWNQKLNIVGSDIDNFGCRYCGSHDRERHLFMFFDKLDMWTKFKNAKVLHFAPEKNLADKIVSLNPEDYVKADLFPANESIVKIDLQDIHFENNFFDIVICNHVLEHVPDYKKALQEIFRVLKPNGIAILQTPYSNVLEDNFEDSGINTDELRSLFYGQKDHLRYFSKKRFLNSLNKVGFKLEIVEHKAYFDEQQAELFGVNSKEELIQVKKP